MFFVWLGYIIMTKGGFVFYGYYSSFSGYKIIIGTILIGIGVFVTCFVLRKKAKEFGGKFLICPKCEGSFNNNDVLDNLCPNCEVELEDLEEFYEVQTETDKIKGTDGTEGGRS
jgi:hypothetical protein